MENLVEQSFVKTRGKQGALELQMEAMIILAIPSSDTEFIDIKTLIYIERYSAK